MIGIVRKSNICFCAAYVESTLLIRVHQLKRRFVGKADDRPVANCEEKYQPLCRPRIERVAACFLH